MRDGAVAAQIQIPFVIGRIHLVAAHVFFQHIEPLLALAAADDLADSGHEHIHRSDGFSVVVQPHVERLYLLRIIENRHGTFEVFLGEPALVFRLEIGAVCDGEFELLAARLQQLDCVRISDPLERPLDDEIEPRHQLLVDELREQTEVFRAVRSNIADEVFHHLFREIHVALQIAEGDFRLDHPKLIGVAGRV